MLLYYDADSNQWVMPGTLSGSPPCARSSHRAVSLPDRLVIFGGAVAGEGDNDGGERLNDVHTLRAMPGSGQLAWTQEDAPYGLRPRGEWCGRGGRGRGWAG